VTKLNPGTILTSKIVAIRTLFVDPVTNDVNINFSLIRFRRITSIKDNVV